MRTRRLMKEDKRFVGDLVLEEARRQQTKCQYVPPGGWSAEMGQDE